MWKDKINLKILIWGTLVGGFISALVKWGSEVNMPPRPIGEVSPPGAHIDAWQSWLGFNSHSLDYVYQGHTIGGVVSLYHWLFSFAFAFVYVFLSAYMPRVRMYFGAIFGILVTIWAHGFMIPLLGFRNPSYNEGQVGWLWNLNGYELFSEFIGHIYWSFSIEISLVAVLAYCARPIKGNWTVPKN